MPATNPGGLTDITGIIQYAAGTPAVINIGNVYIINNNQVATGKRSIYITKEEMITLSGGVNLKNGDNLVKGETLIYDMKNSYGKILPLNTPSAQKKQVKAILRTGE